MSYYAFEYKLDQVQKTNLLNIRNTLDDICMSSGGKQPMKKWEVNAVVDSNKSEINYTYYKNLKMYTPNYVRTCNKANSLTDLTRSMIHVYIDEEIKKIDDRNKEIDGQIKALDEEIKKRDDRGKNLEHIQFGRY